MSNSKFNEKDHDNEIYLMEIAINKAVTHHELNIIEQNIKDYKNKYKFLHFSWCINENVVELKNKINEKKNELKIYEYG